MDRKTTETTEGVEICIAIQTEKGGDTYTVYGVGLRGWFDIEDGHFVIPFENKAGMIVALCEIISSSLIAGDLDDDD